MLRNQVPSRWQTVRFLIADSTFDEVEALQTINDIVPQTQGWTRVEGKEESKTPILSALRDGALPPNGRKECFRLQSIRMEVSGHLIGFLGLYHGFPTDEVLWINTLTLHPDFQGRGYGPEVMRGLVDQVRKLGHYHQLRTYVPLKNWPSLRLCVKIGMDRMVKIEGDKVWSEGAEAHVLLAKDLK